MRECCCGAQRRFWREITPRTLRFSCTKAGHAPRADAPAGTTPHQHLPGAPLGAGGDKGAARDVRAPRRWGLWAPGRLLELLLASAAPTAPGTAANARAHQPSGGAAHQHLWAAWGGHGWQLGAYWAPRTAPVQGAGWGAGWGSRGCRCWGAVPPSSPGEMVCTVPACPAGDIGVPRGVPARVQQHGRAQMCLAGIRSHSVRGTGLGAREG